MMDITAIQIFAYYQYTNYFFVTWRWDSFHRGNAFTLFMVFLFPFLIFFLESFFFKFNKSFLVWLKCNSCTIMFQLARKNTLVELIKLHQLDQIRKPRVAVVQGVEHFAVIFHLPEENQQISEKGKQPSRTITFYCTLCLYIPKFKLI